MRNVSPNARILGILGTLLINCTKYDDRQITNFKIPGASTISIVREKNNTSPTPISLLPGGEIMLCGD